MIAAVATMAVTGTDPAKIDEPPAEMMIGETGIEITVEVEIVTIGVSLPPHLVVANADVTIGRIGRRKSPSKRRRTSER